MTVENNKLAPRCDGTKSGDHSLVTLSEGSTEWHRCRLCDRKWKTKGGSTTLLENRTCAQYTTSRS